MALTAGALPKLGDPGRIPPHRKPNRRRHGFFATSSPPPSSLSSKPEEGKLERPQWAGETPLSRLVGALISFKPLYSLMKLGARQVLISTAEKSNIPWREMTREILESDVYDEFEGIRDPNLAYPDYYLSPFHAYDEGNLSWLAAAEAEAATLSIGKRAIPDASSTDEANEILRGSWLKAVDEHHLQFGNSKIKDVLDIGCSIGVSTKYLADTYPAANITGLDLSPYFLAVAQYKEKKRAQRSSPIRWIHANGESTGLPSKSFDLVSLSYVLHECPARAIKGLLKEAFRLLRPGGTIALTDNSPKSKVLQELPPALFTLMKSTEPFLDEYYLLDLENTMQEAGFVNVVSILTDPRHRTVTGTVPRRSAGSLDSFRSSVVGDHASVTVRWSAEGRGRGKVGGPGGSAGRGVPRGVVQSLLGTPGGFCVPDGGGPLASFSCFESVHMGDDVAT